MDNYFVVNDCRSHADFGGGMAIESVQCDRSKWNRIRTKLKLQKFRTEVVFEHESEKETSRRNTLTKH